MKFRLSLILSVFLLVVTPIIVTGIVTLEATNKVLVNGSNQSSTVSVNSLEIARVRENVVYLFIIGTVLSLTGAGIFATSMANSVNQIKKGLDSIGKEPDVNIPPMGGVLGEIAESINQMARNLSEMRGHRDALLESSPNGIISTDRLGKIVLFNPAAAALTGVAAKDAVGQDFRYVGLAKAIVAQVAKALAEGATKEPEEEILQRKDGNTVAVAVSTAQLVGQTGEVEGALALVTDLREKRLLEAQVLRANRLAGLGELAAGIAHEIRNPLTAVKGFSQVLEEELPSGDEKHEYTAVIIKEVNRLEKLVQGLLAFARPAPSNFRMADLAEIMEETLVLVESGSFKRRITVSKHYSADNQAEVDREQLKQVFLNLLLNAGQAINGPGNIEIQMRKKDGYVWVSIKDSGCGIPIEYMDKLFDPFFTTKEHGTGLGLPTVHRLIEIHGGSVTVSSNSNGGTEIIIGVPVHQGVFKNV